MPAEMAAVDSALFRQAGPSIFLQAALQNRKTLEQEAERPVANWVRLLADGSFETETVDARKVWDERLSVMSSPYLKARMQATLDELCAEKAKTYTLPDGQATDIFNNLVAPFRGKWVYIDFWSTGCGPCRAGIEASKALRKKIASSPDLELVFITGDRSTPAAAYEKYVAEHLAGEVSYRIPEAQYIQLTTLFGFNGIPHNELVTPDGQIVNGSLPRLGDDGFLEALEKLK
jgi:thiol-disulfide isomerase/thioredoxin